jgi:hypothetical protein
MHGGVSAWHPSTNCCVWSEACWTSDTTSTEVAKAVGIVVFAGGAGGAGAGPTVVDIPNVVTGASVLVSLVEVSTLVVVSATAFNSK